MSWIYALRNETKDGTLKHALEKISCITEPNDRQLNDQEDNDDNGLPDDSYDYYDRNEEYSEKNKSKTNRSVKLIDIPIEDLPCPKELMQTEYDHPVQNEIRLKAYSKANRIVQSLILIVIALF